MVVMRLIKTVWSIGTSAVQNAPGLARLRGGGRKLGILGLLAELVSSAVQSASALDPMILVKGFALNLVQINQGLESHIVALQGGVTGMTYLWNILGIYSKLWLILFVTSAVATYMQHAHLGDDIPKYQLYMVVFLFFITPLQMLGSVIVDVLTTGGLTQGQLWSVVNFWSGLQMAAGNIDILVEPVIDTVGNLSGSVPMSDVVNLESNSSLNSTGSVQTINT